jgi:hypothetical protein
MVVVLLALWNKVNRITRVNDRAPPRVPHVSGFYGVSW